MSSRAQGLGVQGGARSSRSRSASCCSASCSWTSSSDGVPYLDLTLLHEPALVRPRRSPARGRRSSRRSTWACCCCSSSSRSASAPRSTSRSTRTRPLVQPAARDQHPEPRRRALDRLRHPRPRVLVRGFGLGRVLLAGALILTLLVLPTVIIAVARGDPGGARLDPAGRLRPRRDPVAGRLAPGAAGGDPGIATGSILALSRAIGETAPLILIGAVTFISFDPTILGPFTALPIQIFQYLRLPQEEFKLLAAAASSCCSRSS